MRAATGNRDEVVRLHIGNRGDEDAVGAGRASRDRLLVGDHLIVNKFIFAPAATALERLLLPMRPIERGDIIVFKFPEEPGRDFIKRVIGLPGDTIELKNQTVSVNGQALTEPYAHYLFPPAGEGQADVFDVRRKYGPVTVPDGHYFMMGDNRYESKDSRYWGVVPRNNIRGRPMFVYYSWDPDSHRPLPFITAIRWGRIGHRIR